MVGSGCVALATDHRFGTDRQTNGIDFPKIYRVSESTFVGLPGLLSDSQSVFERVFHHKSMNQSRYSTGIYAEEYASMLSNFLYAHRFGPYYVQPIVAGMRTNGKTFLCDMDLIGFSMPRNTYIAVGSCEDQLNGMLESVWRENMNKEQLFMAMSEVLDRAFERDCMSGSGATIYVIERSGAEIRNIKNNH